MSYDAYDREDVADRKSRRKAKASQAQRDIQRVCSEPEGRRVLARILAETGYLGPSFVPNDPLGTAYREGQRSIGIALHTALTSAGDHLPRAILAENVQGDD